MNIKKLNKKVNMTIRYEIYNYFYVKNIDEIIKLFFFGVSFSNGNIVLNQYTKTNRWDK